MNEDQKNILIQKVLNKYELYKLSGSRIKRLIKEPFHVTPFFILQLLAYIKPFKVKYKTLWGDSMSFYLPEGGMIYQYGFFEANLTNFLIRFLKSGDTFLDIGAHVGTYTILASKLVGDSGKVYAFEPTPRTFNTLKKNSLIRENIHVYNNAILNEEKEIEFFDYGPKFSAFNTFKKREDENISFRDHVQKISVKTIALDNFCKEKNINPNFIKIDAEGAEYLILNAMEEILKEIKPVISIEVSNTPELKENSNRSVENLYSKGYVGYVAASEGFLNKHIIGKEYAYENIIFVHETKLEEVKNLIITKP